MIRPLARLIEALPLYGAVALGSAVGGGARAGLGAALSGTRRSGSARWRRGFAPTP